MQPAAPAAISDAMGAAGVYDRVDIQSFRAEFLIDLPNMPLAPGRILAHKPIVRCSNLSCVVYILAGD
jgi:hypothetical protein